jgi:hypothetical protein
MRKLKVEDNGMIYQIADVIEGHEVIVDITYSNELDESDNEVLEFVFASAEEDSNPTLSEKELEDVNKTLEKGLEETYVILLQAYYNSTDIKFDIGEYKYNPLSTLYDKEAKQ